MSKISATVVADSLSPQQHRLTSLIVVFPRIILAELNTHRILSKNSASSRAIPTRKLIQMVKENPFIPIAWQKEHTGMQGNEYFDMNEKFSILELESIMFPRLMKLYNTEDKDDLEVIQAWKSMFVEFQCFGSHTLTEFWLMIRYKVVNCVTLLYCLGVTKQLANRLLEPFLWHTVLLSGTEWENFFELRCPQYLYGEHIQKGYDIKFAKSKKDWLSRETLGFEFENSKSILDWLLLNKGQAEIHMMALAEAIYDAMSESKPKQLQAGQWHIVFEDKLPDDDILEDLLNSIKYIPSKILNNVDFLTLAKISISTAMGARTSYTIVEDEKEINYQNLITLDDKIISAKPIHASPLEHCSRAMSDEEYNTSIKGKITLLDLSHPDANPNHKKELGNIVMLDASTIGWCRNFRGFIQRRHLMETNQM